MWSSTAGVKSKGEEAQVGNGWRRRSDQIGRRGVFHVIWDGVLTNQRGRIAFWGASNPDT